MQISEDADNEALRGKKVTGVFEVLEVKKLELPELTPELLEELGDFELEADLRDALKDSLASAWNTSSSSVPASRSPAP